MDTLMPPHVAPSGIPRQASWAKSGREHREAGNYCGVDARTVFLLLSPFSLHSSLFAFFAFFTFTPRVSCLDIAIAVDYVAHSQPLALRTFF